MSRFIPLRTLVLDGPNPLPKVSGGSIWDAMQPVPTEVFTNKGPVARERGA